MVVQSDDHNGDIEKCESFRINVLHLYGFMFLSGGIESDNHNGDIEKCETRSDK